MPQKGNSKGRGDLAELLCAVMTHPRCPIGIWGRMVDGLKEIHEANVLSAYTDPKIIRELLRLQSERAKAERGGGPRRGDSAAHDAGRGEAPHER